MDDSRKSPCENFNNPQERLRKYFDNEKIIHKNQRQLTHKKNKWLLLNCFT